MQFPYVFLPDDRTITIPPAVKYKKRMRRDFPESPDSYTVVFFRANLRFEKKKKRRFHPDYKIRAYFTYLSLC